MKNFKRILAALLALTLVMALGITAFAEDPAYSITVTNSNTSISIKGNTYYAYKLFDVVYADTDTTDGPDAYSYTIRTSNPFYTNSNAKAVIETYFTLTKTSGDDTIYNVTIKKDNDGKEIPFTADEAREMADALQAYLPETADGSATASEESATITLNVPGYYLVAGQVDAIHEGHGDTNPKVTSAIAVTTTDPNPSFAVKADAPDIDKWIVNADDVTGTAPAAATDGKGTSVNVGDTVNFVQYSKVPVTTGYDSYKFIVHDTMSDGLTLNSNPSSFIVTIGGKTLTEGTDYTVTVTGQKFDLKIADLMAKGADNARKYADDEAIVIKYSATLNSNALTTDVETNTVNLEYSSNPYATSETKTTPDHVVYVYDFDIVIDKFTGKLDEGATTTNTKLQGAKFVLYRTVNNVKQYAKIDEGTPASEGVATLPATKAVTWYPLGENETIKAAVAAGNITQVVTDENGYATFTGLEAGTYFLTETEAPTGYNLLTSDVEVEIEATYNTDKSGELLSSSATHVVTKEATETTPVEYGQYKQTQSIQNQSGNELPSTGGIGTTIFYVVGGILLVGAGVLLITKKRMNVED